MDKFAASRPDDQSEGLRPRRPWVCPQFRTEPIVTGTTALTYTPQDGIPGDYHGTAGGGGS